MPMRLPIGPNDLQFRDILAGIGEGLQGLEEGSRIAIEDAVLSGRIVPFVGPLHLIAIPMAGPRVVNHHILDFFTKAFCLLREDH